MDRRIFPTEGKKKYSTGPIPKKKRGGDIRLKKQRIGRGTTSLLRMGTQGKEMKKKKRRSIDNTQGKKGRKEGNIEGKGGGKKTTNSFQKGTETRCGDQQGIDCHGSEGEGEK